MPSKPNSTAVKNSKPTSVPPKQQTSEAASTVSAKQANAFAVNHLSNRAHPSRSPPNISDGRLPSNYKQAARKYTSVMVALPIAIVTSYMLYDRLVLGTERKKLIRDTPDPSIQPVTGTKTD